MARPASLSLTMPKSSSVVSSIMTSSTYTGRDSPPPVEAKAINGQGMERSIGHTGSIEDQPTSPEFTSLPPFPSSPTSTSRQAREASRGFFSNLKASKSSSKVHHIEPTIRQVSEDVPRNHTADSVSITDPSLSSSVDNTSVAKSEDQQPQIHKVSRRPIGGSMASDSLAVPSPTEWSRPKKPKPRLAGLLTRTRSIRMDDPGRKSKPSTPMRSTGPEIRMQYDGPSEDENYQVSPKTAPLHQERSYHDLMGSSTRNRSADRKAPSNHSQENMPLRRGDKLSNSGLSTSSTGISREGAGSHLFTNIKNTSNKAAGGLGKASKSIFGKVARSGSSNAREEERYALRVINLPLVEQTRHTRIASRLEDSKDKTEFWMPALPWRCIDFLNSRGCEEEGLYRIPGSEVQIRHWQKRFDQEGDINLFDEPELYDINIIGSMFKAWLRDLPTEILPKEVQARVAQDCAGATECPQLLKDELSSLPPWNYYLLFAITCHLSLLIAYSDKNKMNFPNLCVCFQPALKIDNFCFQFLVQNWRNCWQGCWTEKVAVEKEYSILDGRLHSSDSGGDSEDSSPGSTAVAEERSLASTDSHNVATDERSSSYPTTSDEHSLASSGSRKPSASGRSQQARPTPLSLTQSSEEQLSTIYSEAASTPKAMDFDDDSDWKKLTSTSTSLPELAPVKPISPIVHHFH